VSFFLSFFIEGCWVSFFPSLLVQGISWLG
jgi:hypothetical protein